MPCQIARRTSRWLWLILAFVWFKPMSAGPWQEPGTRRQAFYNDLRPGTYRFRVTASNNDGLLNEERAALDFVMLPAWYQTNWFVVLCVVTGVVAVGALYRLRMHKVAQSPNALRTSTAQENELVQAFRRAIEDCERESSIEASFSVIGDAKEIHPVVRDEVCWIGCEAIRNACRHSRGGRLEIVLTYSQDLTLRIADNGVGINQAIVDEGKERHSGLQGMLARAARIGAKLNMASSANVGTEITVLVPGSIVFRKPPKR
jgi:Y_Y_Y domain